MSRSPGTQIEGGVKASVEVCAAGVLSVWGRTAGTLAMLATSLDQVSHGRFVLGLGARSPQLVEGLHDQSFTAPVAKLRAVTAQVRRLLDGDRVRPTATRDHRPLRLGVAARTGLPIYLAGLGNKSIQLAGEVAGGWVPFLATRSWLPCGIDLLPGGERPIRPHHTFLGVPGRPHSRRGRSRNRS